MPKRRIFDLRVLIGVVFTLYGLVLGVAGLLDSGEQLAKAGGLPINLWTGIGMFALGVLFLLWSHFGGDEGRPEQRAS